MLKIEKRKKKQREPCQEIGSCRKRYGKRWLVNLQRIGFLDQTALNEQVFRSLRHVHFCKQFSSRLGIPLLMRILSQKSPRYLLMRIKQLVQFVENHSNSIGIQIKTNGCIEILYSYQVQFIIRNAALQCILNRNQKLNHQSQLSIYHTQEIQNFHHLKCPLLKTVKGN